MRAALHVGLLVGLAEVCWSYFLPVISDDWRAVLPVNLPELLAFAAAAVATDTAVMALGAVLWIGLLIPLGRLRLISRRLPQIGPHLVLWSGLCYLYLGWTMFFVFLSTDRNRMVYRLILMGGVVVLLFLTLGLGKLSAAVVKRWPRRGWVVKRVVPLAGLLLILLPAYNRQRTSQQRTPDIAMGSEGPRPHVLLVTIDTLRADYLGCYGHPWIQTPTLDGVAGDGVLFEAAISQAPSTCPSHCSMLTSTYPFDHGAENGKPMRRGLVSLSDVLKAHGYETAAFVSSTTTRSISSGLHQGFEQYEDSLVSWSTAFSRDDFQNLILFYLVGIAQQSQIPGGVVTDRALDWLDRRSDRPFFAWLHYFDPHAPYGAPPPFRDMYTGRADPRYPLATERERYAEDITYADAQLGRFIDEMKVRGLYDETLIIITSDHGEAFGEVHDDTSDVGHGGHLYDATQIVPLIIKPPGSSHRPRRVAQQIELVDLAPTVLRFLRIPRPGAWIGQPLNELLEGRSDPDPERMAYSFNTVGAADPDSPHKIMFPQQIAVRSTEWKFITVPRTAHEELYYLPDDPHERINRAEQRPEVVAEFRLEAGKFWDPQRSTADPRRRLAPGVIRQLEALGYVGDDPEEDEDAID